MTIYLIALAWGAVILFSWVGWGRFVTQLTFPRNVFHWSQLAVFGMAMTILIGSWLNLTWTISPKTILVLLGMGVLGATPVIRQGTHQALTRLRACQWAALDIINAILFVSVSAIILLFYCRWAHTDNLNFNWHDDAHAYLVFPQKMLQLGSLGADPFSERRLFTPGGTPFLHTLVLCVLPMKNIALVDLSLGFVIIAGLIHAMLRRRKTATPLICLFIFAFLLVPINRCNVTATFTPMEVLFGLFLFLDSLESLGGGPLSRALLVGLLASAAAALKPTMIPYAVVALFGIYFCRALGPRSRRNTLAEFLLAGGFSLFFFFPWMLSMYRSSGTLLFPLLGKGFHGSSYGVVKISPVSLASFFSLSNFSRALSENFFLACFALAIFSGCWSLTRIRRGGTALSFFVAASASFLLLMQTSAFSASVYMRYAWPFLIPTIFILAAECLKGRSYIPRVAFVTAAIALIFNNLMTIPEEVMASINNFKSIPGPQLVSDEAEYRALQNSIPPNETILERLSAPFCMDFRRNQIYVADYPGSASPPSLSDPRSGMPLHEGPEKLAEYLQSESIRYVAYSYRSACNSGGTFCQDIPDYPFAASEWQNTCLFQDNLQKLGETRQRIYDDGSNFVLDLTQRKRQPSDLASGPKQSGTGKL